MKNKCSITTALMIALPLGFMFLGCNSTTSNTPDNTPTAQMNISTNLDPMVVLSKGSVISLAKLIFVFTSSANDTIRDTLTSSTTPPLNVTSTVAQTLSKNYTFKALRSWKVVAVVKDAKDSITNKDSATTPVLLSGDTAHVSLNLSSIFTMYEARFLTIPDSISSLTPGTVKEVLHINRLTLAIDTVVKVDSTATPGPYFTPLATAILSYDYVKVGSHAIKLMAYGRLGTSTVSNPLYSGTTTINVAAGADSTVPLTLTWIGSTTGIGNISATIGKIGKVTVTAALPGTIP